MCPLGAAFVLCVFECQLQCEGIFCRYSALRVAEVEEVHVDWARTVVRRGCAGTLSEPSPFTYPPTSRDFGGVAHFPAGQGGS